jgi:hypothetical protein
MKHASGGSVRPALIVSQRTTQSVGSINSIMNTPAPMACGVPAGTT